MVTRPAMMYGLQTVLPKKKDKLEAAESVDSKIFNGKLEMIISEVPLIAQVEQFWRQSWRGKVETVWTCRGGRVNIKSQGC